jgi:hypothetical protein
MDAHLTPANRARIRSAASELPLDAWLALAAAPVADMEDVRTRQVWETVARALGVVRPWSLHRQSGPVATHDGRIPRRAPREEIMRMQELAHFEAAALSFVGRLSMNGSCRFRLAQ